MDPVIDEAQLARMERAKTFASKYEDWQPEYNWGNCKTNRQEYGKFLCSFLTNSKDGLVVNLNGSWGTGKTQLLRRLYVELAEQNHPVVYINAWESDFCNDALSVVSSEFLNQLGFIFSSNADKSITEKFNELKDGFGTCMKLLSGGASLVGEPVTAATASAAGSVVDTLPKAESNSVVSNNVELVDKISQAHANRVLAMQDIKKQITALSLLMNEIHDLEAPIVVLVDELDRCRPIYAIEMLEVIKHFFEAKGCVFLVATDTEALQHSVNAVYGAKFNSASYLKRFFARKIALSEISSLRYLKSKEFDFEKYSELGIRLHPFTKNQNYNIKYMAAVAKLIGFELRDIDQVIQKFFASLDFIAKTRMNHKSDVINTVVLFTGIAEHHNGMTCFYNRESNVHIDSEIRCVGNVLDGISVNDLMQSQLNAVVKVMSREVHSGGGSSISRGDNSNIECLKIQSYNFIRHATKRYDDFVFHEEMRSLIQLSESTVDRYWLWDDYKMLIELSGHIE
ncbi:hypothetical protein Ssed_0472 [Shewanella sediminis HAW-EB3]|uniref:KAP NTPase domain-containing protein n=1 Tax=Shewanella sediminis (strain HAW-EB3) TaxID=425104 RepID=A8FQG2_SHESH|nr:P-loop NTPase fold protein [Shewanella sediminis]ABV35085.1 hypothetical protein Ssed_0472 [Shewanella sediminis HAW-EB3]